MQNSTTEKSLESTTQTHLPKEFQDVELSQSFKRVKTVRQHTNRFQLPKDMATNLNTKYGGYNAR